MSDIDNTNIMTKVLTHGGICMETRIEFTKKMWSCFSTSFLNEIILCTITMKSIFHSCSIFN